MANANWSNPTLTSTYTNFVPEVKNRDEDCATQFASFTGSNQVTGTIKWDSSANRWKKWTGSAWGELTATYALTALTTTGTASFGGNATVTGTLDVSSGITAGSFAPDSSTAPPNGISLSAANQLLFSTNSNPRITIASDGDIGINDTTPTAKLDVNGGIKAKGGTSGDVGYTFNSNDTDGGMFSGADNQIQFKTNNTPRLTIEGANIGIGDTTPSTRLQVHEASAAACTITISNTEGLAQLSADGDKLSLNADGHHFNNQAGSNKVFIDTANTRLIVGATSASHNLHVQGTANITSTITANLFSGNGSSLTSLNASNISSGTIAAARVPTLNQSTTGNASTATQLATARTIGGVSFNGASNINLPGVNQTGNQNTTGNAATASLCTGNSITASNWQASNATNRILYQAGTNNTDPLPAGNSGQVLKSNGSSAPSWEDLGSLGGVKGFISFTGSNGNVITQSKLTVSRTGTGAYTITLDSSIRDGTSYGVVVGNVDEERADNQKTDGNDNFRNCWISSRSTNSFTLRAQQFNRETFGHGGDDEQWAVRHNRVSCDPDEISLIVI